MLPRLVGLAGSKTVLAITGQGFASGTNFATGLLIGRMCTQEELGLYYLGFTILTFVIEMQNALISTPYMVYAPRLAPQDHARYTGSTLVHEGVLCLGVSLLLGLYALIAASGGGPTGFSPVAGALALFLSLVLLRDFVRRICFANLQMRAALAIDVASALLQLGGLGVLAGAGGLNAASAYAIIGLASGLTVAAWFVLYRHLFRPSAAAAREDFRRSWHFARWSFASAALWSVSISAYPWLITYFRGTADAGIWAACMTTVNLGNILLMGVQNFLGPRIAVEYAQGGGAAMRRFVWIAALSLGVPLAVLALAMFAVGNQVLVLFYGADYAGNGLVLSLLVLNLVSMAMGFNFSRGLFALERADIDFAVNFVALLMLLSAGVWLVYRYGVAGAAAGLLLSNVASCAVRGWAFDTSAQRATGATP